MRISLVMKGVGARDRMGQRLGNDKCVDMIEFERMRCLDFRKCEMRLSKCVPPYGSLLFYCCACAACDCCVRVCASVHV